MSSRQHWFCHWLLGIAAVASFSIAQVAFYQRDEAKRLAKPVIEMSGNTWVVTCPKQKTPIATGQPLPHPRFIL
ncbi:hypothetical protein ACFOJE_20770 [Azotobacter bryophylli]|uniref:Uncharacterized protein n=1 Tax=Azotobacter bryophylli TaxID=1986537 RepID=A0ABV7AYI0_9GAMM